MGRQSGRMEVLHSIRPDLQMLKQLGRKVQEAKVKMNQLRKAVKGLQRELEVGEGEHWSTEEKVLELREVGKGKKVQVVDSLQREAEQLEKKLAELGGKVREARAGARSLEAVRKKAEDLSRTQLSKWPLSVNPGNIPLIALN